MAAFAKEKISETMYKVCKFRFKKDRDLWVGEKQARRSIMSNSTRDNRLYARAKKYLSGVPGFCKCVRVTDWVRPNQGKKNADNRHHNK